MKIVFATEGRQGLQDNVAQHFGRCPTYTVVEILDDSTPQVKVVENPTLINHQPGAAPQFIAGLGADYMVTGGMGPRAIQMFESLGVHAVTGAAGKVSDNLDALLRQLREGGVLPGPAPCEEHQGH